MATSAVAVTVLLAVATAAATAQTVTPSPVKPTPTTPPPATPAPAQTTQQLLDSLGQAELQAAINFIKSNFSSAAALNDDELNRALLQGLLARYPQGLVLLGGATAATAENPAPFYAEIFEGRIGYLRLGALNSANLKALDQRLAEFGPKKIDALIVDLREKDPGSDFGVAAEFAKRFCPKGKLLFTLRKPAARQERQFISERDPAFRGLFTVLVDADTSGAAEPLAAALRVYNKALIIGEATPGRAVEYAEKPLPGGKVLRVATAEAVAADGQPLFPGGIKPDLDVAMPAAEKRQIFQASAEKGMAPFVYETERPHLNEAALIAGTNPELDTAVADRRNRAREKQPVRDPVLQRALDVLTSLEIYQKR